LKDNGMIVAPVGGRDAQELVVETKKDEKLTERFICNVRFVKLIGEHAFEQ
jgi:protein-L-isoaspartate O-methyltransferase